MNDIKAELSAVKSKLDAQIAHLEKDIVANREAIPAKGRNKHMARKYDRDPLTELERLLGARSLEEILQDPEAHFSVGEIASLGAAYERLGEILISKARELALPRVRDEETFTDDSIRFDLWGGYEYQRLDYARIKKRFPPKTHGHFYEPVFREEVAAIRVLKK